MCATSEQNHSHSCNKKKNTQDMTYALAVSLDDDKVFHLKKSLHYVRWSLKSEITKKKKDLWCEIKQKYLGHLSWVNYVNSLIFRTTTLLLVLLHNSSIKEKLILGNLQFRYNIAIKFRFDSENSSKWSQKRIDHWSSQSNSQWHFLLEMIHYTIVSDSLIHIYIAYI